MRRKPQKRTPELPVFEGEVPYISEMSQVKKQNLPYITQMRPGWNGDIARSDLARLHAAAYSRGVARGLAVDPRTCN